MTEHYLSDEQIDEALSELDFVATRYDIYGCGLPTHYEPTRDAMRSKLRTLESAAIAAYAAQQAAHPATGGAEAMKRSVQTGPSETLPLADGDAPCVLEWGAVSLPLGHASRVTETKLMPTLWDAIAEGALCGFDWRVYVFVDVTTDALKKAALASPAVKEAPAVVPAGDAEEGCTPADARMLRAANHGLIDELHEAMAVLRELHGQVTRFCEEEGEWEFETGPATRLLKKFDREEAPALVPVAPALPAVKEAGQGEAVAGKYDDVLRPFMALMERELHANSAKGDRPGWLKMGANTALLEIYWHTAKLSAAVKNNDGDRITEHAADVANMAMMLLDVCGGLAVAALADQEPSAAYNRYVDASGVHCNRMPSWSELSDAQKDEWRRKHPPSAATPSMPAPATGGKEGAK